MKTLLEVRGLSVWYGKAIALEDVSVSVGEGEIVAVLGPNGAGKSTLLKAVSRMQPSQGVLELAGQSLQPLQAHEVVGRGICHCPEGRRLFPELTTLKNLMLGAYLRRDREGIARDLDFVYALFPILRERAGQVVSTMSGGQQQMVALARVMLNPARLLLVDEPTKGLAPKLVEQVGDALTRIAERTTVLLVEQNLPLVRRIARDAIVLDTGRVVHRSPAADLMADETLLDSLLGVSAAVPDPGKATR